MFWFSVDMSLWFNELYNVCASHFAFATDVPIAFSLYSIWQHRTNDWSRNNEKMKTNSQMDFVKHRILFGIVGTCFKPIWKSLSRGVNVEIHLQLNCVVNQNNLTFGYISISFFWLNSSKTKQTDRSTPQKKRKKMFRCTVTANKEWMSNAECRCSFSFVNSSLELVHLYIQSFECIMCGLFNFALAYCHFFHYLI